MIPSEDSKWISPSPRSVIFLAPNFSVMTVFPQPWTKTFLSYFQRQGSSLWLSLLFSQLFQLSFLSGVHSVTILLQIPSQVSFGCFMKMLSWPVVILGSFIRVLHHVPSASFCHALPRFKDWVDWVDRQWRNDKKTGTHAESLQSGRPSALYWRHHQQPRNSTLLPYTSESGSRFTVHSWTRRWG